MSNNKLNQMEISLLDKCKEIQKELKNLLSNDQLGHSELALLFKTFDYRLLRSDQESSRKLAGLYVSALFHKIFTRRSHFEEVASIFEAQVEFKTPFFCRGQFIYISTPESGSNFSFEQQYVSSPVGRQEKILFSYYVPLASPQKAQNNDQRTASPEKSSLRFIGVCIDRLLHNIASPWFLDCLPDPQNTCIFIYSMQGTQVPSQCIRFVQTNEEEPINSNIDLASASTNRLSGEIDLSVKLSKLLSNESFIQKQQNLTDQFNEEIENGDKKEIISADGSLNRKTGKKVRFRMMSENFHSSFKYNSEKSIKTSEKNPERFKIVRPGFSTFKIENSKTQNGTDSQVYGSRSLNEGQLKSQKDNKSEKSRFFIKIKSKTQSNNGSQQPIRKNSFNISPPTKENLPSDFRKYSNQKVLEIRSDSAIQVRKRSVTPFSIIKRPSGNPNQVLMDRISLFSSSMLVPSDNPEFHIKEKRTNLRNGGNKDNWNVSLERTLPGTNAPLRCTEGSDDRANRTSLQSIKSKRHSNEERSDDKKISGQKRSTNPLRTPRKSSIELVPEASILYNNTGIMYNPKLEKIKERSLSSPKKKNTGFFLKKTKQASRGL